MSAQLVLWAESMSHRWSELVRPGFRFRLLSYFAFPWLLQAARGRSFPRFSCRGGDLQLDWKAEHPEWLLEVKIQDGLAVVRVGKRGVGLRLRSFPCNAEAENPGGLPR